MNLYCRPSHVFKDIGGLAYSPAHAVLPELLRAIAEVSREAEDVCGGRRFYAEQATRYFDGPKRGGRELWLPVDGTGDLISVTTLKTDENTRGTYDEAYTEGTDFRLGPFNATPKYQLLVHPESSRLSSWPRGEARVQVVGLFGFSYELEAVGLTGTLADASDTGLLAGASADAVIDVGETIVQGTEQMYVSAVSGTAVTVVRGINGTTAAAHVAGTAIYRRRYPRAVEEAVRSRVIEKRWDNQEGFSGQDYEAVGPQGRVTVGYARWKSALGPYALKGVA